MILASLVVIKGGGNLFDIESSSRKLARDEDGFFLHSEDWNEKVVEILADDKG